MALKFLIHNYLFLFLYTGAGGATIMEIQKEGIINLSWGLAFLAVMIFAPEITIALFKSFRGWIKEGLEDADGKFNKEDIKDMVILYCSLWFLRVFIFFSWAQVFHDPAPAASIYIIPLLGSFGTAGLTVLRSIRR